MGVQNTRGRFSINRCHEFSFLLSWNFYTRIGNLPSFSCSSDRHIKMTYIMERMKCSADSNKTNHRQIFCKKLIKPSSTIKVISTLKTSKALRLYHTVLFDTVISYRIISYRIIWYVNYGYLKVSCLKVSLK